MGEFACKGCEEIRAGLRNKRAARKSSVEIRTGSRNKQAARRSSVANTGGSQETSKPPVEVVWQIRAGVKKQASRP